MRYFTNQLQYLFPKYCIVLCTIYSNYFVFNELGKKCVIGMCVFKGLFVVKVDRCDIACTIKHLMKELK